MAEPGAVVFEGRVYLFFAAVALRDGGVLPQAKMTIGLAISDDGTSFSTPMQVLEQSLRYPASGHYVGYSTPPDLATNGKFHLFYDVAQNVPGWVQVALHHAVSTTGMMWAEDDEPIFVRGNFVLTQREIRSPTVIHDGHQLKMWFAGDDYLDKNIWGIGYARADDGIY